MQLGFVGDLAGGLEAIMAEIFTCANCQRKLQIPEQFLGQKVQCPECGHMFIAASASVSAEPLPTSTPAARASSTSSARQGGDDDDIPRRRRNRFGDDDDFDDIDSSRRIRQNFVPHRGGLIMALGLVSLIGGWLFCLPIVVGPIAWILAQADLRAIRDGHMDPTGESMVRTGQVCGIISTIILVVLVLIVVFVVFTGMNGF